MTQREIADILRSLGIARSYQGYVHVMRAVFLILENEDRLQNITREIYERIALEAGAASSAVERNIRTIAHRAWDMNPALLQKMAGYPLEKPPSSTAFLEMICSFILRRQEGNKPSAEGE